MSRVQLQCASLEAMFSLGLYIAIYSVLGSANHPCEAGIERVYLAGLPDLAGTGTLVAY